MERVFLDPSTGRQLYQTWRLRAPGVGYVATVSLGTLAADGRWYAELRDDDLGMTAEALVFTADNLGKQEALAEADGWKRQFHGDWYAV